MLRTSEKTGGMFSARPEPAVACDIRRSFSIHPQGYTFWLSSTQHESKTTNDDHERAMAGMNGTRVSVVVFATSFLLGTSNNPSFERRPHAIYNTGLLFTHWIADSLTLWKPPATDERLWMSATYYSVITKAPIGFLYFFAFVAIGGGLTILWCLREGEAGNLMFDGGSICSYRLILFSFSWLMPRPAVLYASALAVYMHTVLPSRSRPDPSNRLTLGSRPSFLDLRANFVTLPEYVAEVPEPLKRSTLELASSHLVCSVALTGVLALQAGRWWAENNNDPDN